MCGKEGDRPHKAQRYADEGGIAAIVCVGRIRSASSVEPPPASRSVGTDNATSRGLRRIPPPAGAGGFQVAGLNRTGSHANLRQYTV
jgi:hypothetical protein